MISFFNKGKSFFEGLPFCISVRNKIYVLEVKVLGPVLLAINLYCDTKSRNYRLFSEGLNLCLNPASRRCDPMEACAHGVSMTGMKPS